MNLTQSKITDARTEITSSASNHSSCIVRYYTVTEFSIRSLLHWICQYWYQIWRMHCVFCVLLFLCMYSKILKWFSKLLHLMNLNVNFRLFSFFLNYKETIYFSFSYKLDYIYFFCLKYKPYTVGTPCLIAELRTLQIIFYYCYF